MTTKADLESVAEIALKVGQDLEAQLVFSRARPRRSVEACDAEIDRMMDDMALLAKGIAILASSMLSAHLYEFTPPSDGGG